MSKLLTFRVACKEFNQLLNLKRVKQRTGAIELAKHIALCIASQKLSMKNNYSFEEYERLICLGLVDEMDYNLPEWYTKDIGNFIVMRHSHPLSP